MSVYQIYYRLYIWLDKVCHYLCNLLCTTFLLHFFFNFKLIITNIAKLLLGYEDKHSLEGSLDLVLFVAELDFLKILLPRLPQNPSNVNIECTTKSK